MALSIKKDLRYVFRSTCLLPVFLLLTGTVLAQMPRSDAPDSALTRLTAPVPENKVKPWYDRIALRGYVQFRYNRLLETNPDLKSEHDKSIGRDGGFLIRRARLVFSGNVHDRVYIYIQPDLASMPSSSGSVLHFAQVRDAYFDLSLDHKKEYRFRVGQSKVPYGFENMQSSQNRLTLDRNDALNSAVPNERDLGVFFYWAPEHIRQRFNELANSTYKGSGDYGVFGLGVYNGQSANKKEANDNQHIAADLSQTLEQKVYYHKVGTDQADDKLIFERNNPALKFRFQTTSDERFFVLKEINEKAGKRNIFYIDYQEAEPALKPLFINLTYGLNILDSRDGKFIATTHKDNNGSILEIDPANPLKWRSISSTFTKALLLDVVPLKDKIIATYQTNQRPLVTVFDYTGKILYNLELPAGTSISDFTGNPTDEEFLFHLTSYLYPPVVYSFNVNTYQRKVAGQTRINYKIDDLEIKEAEATAQDGTKIPLLMVHKKGMTTNGKNPTILSAYGGFGSVSTPYFDPGIVYFVKQGGIFVFANIRGGGDLGASWAAQGRGTRKQTSFDDFIASAEFLIKQGYTSPEKLATTGGSNGGLVVAAAAIQRPDLFKAVVPVVAPLDMLRFEKFTAGRFWIEEYGTVAKEESFKNLQKYSPYHNIKPEMNYPAMLIMTSDNDDRVVPLHSYKFAAKLQNRPAQKNPVLLRTEKNAGHYGAATISGQIHEKANMYAFIWEMLHQQQP